MKESHKPFHTQIDNLYVTGATGAGNNWTNGQYTEGAEHVDAVKDMRVQQEKTDATQAFSFYHSIGGGKLCAVFYKFFLEELVLDSEPSFS